jgi:CRP-like cAMP-binding protein
MNVRHDQLTIRPAKPVPAMRTKAKIPDRDVAAALRLVPAFRALSPATLTRLCAGARIVSVPRGAALFAAGTECPGFYVVASGRFMLSIGSAGMDNKVIRLADPGDIIGLTATLLGAATFLGAEALMDSTAVLVARDTLFERSAHDAQLAQALATIAAQHTLTLARDLEAVSLHSGRERIADYLLAGAKEDAGTLRSIVLPAKKSIIASLLSVTPEYFSRTLHELISTGAVEVNGRQIIIRDASRLRSSTPGTA